MREVMCGYGSCQKTDTPWVLSISHDGGAPGENKRFCSGRHMGLWMIDHASKCYQLSSRVTNLLHEVGEYAQKQGEAWRKGAGAEIMDAYSAYFEDDKSQTEEKRS